MSNPPTPWRESTGEYLNHAIGRFGEQLLQDTMRREGFVVLYGASGSTRTPTDQPHQRVHQPTTKGIDTVLYRPTDHQVLVVDNKGDAGAPSGASSAPIGEVSAFTDNLRQKVRTRITHMEAARAGLPPQMAGHMNKVIADLRKVDTALANGGRNWPPNVAFALSNAGGTASGVSPALTARLRAAGIKNIQFIDFRGPRVRQIWVARDAVPFRKFGPARTRVQGSLTRLPSLARLGLTGFAMTGTIVGMASNASASPGLATAAEMFDPKGLMKQAMMKNMGKLAQPRPDARAISEILRDPTIARTLRLIDLLDKDLRPFADEHPEKDRQAVLDVLPDDVGGTIPLAEIKRHVHAAGGDFIPSIERVLADLEASNKVSTVSGPGVRGGKVWYRSSGRAHRPSRSDVAVNAW